MTSQVAERIEIINRFKPMYYTSRKTKGSDMKSLKHITSLDYGLVMLLLVLLIIISILKSLNIDSALVGNWGNAGVLVVMAMSFSVREPYGYIEKILQKHSKEIKASRIDFDEKLNRELAFLIAKFSNKKKSLYPLGVPSILIMIAAFITNARTKSILG